MGYFGTVIARSSSARRYRWTTRLVVAISVLFALWAALQLPILLLSARYALLLAILSVGLWLQSRTWLPRGTLAITSDVLTVQGRYVARRADVTSAWVVARASNDGVGVFVRLDAGEAVLVELEVGDRAQAQKIVDCFSRPT